MAHRSQIPVSVNFTSPKSRWVLGYARVVECERHVTIATAMVPPSVIQSRLPRKELGLAICTELSALGLSCVDREIGYRILNAAAAKNVFAKFGPAGGTGQSLYSLAGTFTILIAPDAPEGLYQNRNPWKMRDEFLRLENDDYALLEFANRWGGWDSLALFPIEEMRLILPYNPMCIFPHMVWRMQASYRNALSRPPHDWLSKYAKLRNLREQSKFPYFVAVDGDCRRAIETTITLDLLSNVRFRRCARPDCSNIFSLNTKHKRKYCRHYCGHIESVRKNRLQVQKDKAKKLREAKQVRPQE